MPPTTGPDHSPAPVLGSGVRVVRRGRDRLQVGIAPGRCLVVPDVDDVRRVLTALAAGDPVPATPATAGLLDALDRHRLLRPPTRPARGAVVVRGDLGADPQHWLRTAGLPELPRPGEPRVVVVLARGEPDRGTLDALVREGTAHLLVRAVDGGAVLGPFVEPGGTACLRCVDAHRIDADPGHLPVLERYVDATARSSPMDPPAPLSPLFAALLTGWAVQEAVNHLRGLHPASWSATLELDDGLTGLTATAWLRHPRCGCCWTEPLTPSGTLDT